MGALYTRTLRAVRVRWWLSAGLTIAAALLAWQIGGSVSATPRDHLLPPLPISVAGQYYGLGVLGQTRTYTHTITNNTQTPQVLTLAVASHRGWSGSVNPATMPLGPGASASAVVSLTIPNNARPGTLDVVTLEATAGLLKGASKDSLLAKSDAELAIPPLELGRMVNGTRVYSLTARTATTQFWPGVDTPTAGYNENTFLGPTLVITKNETVQMQGPTT